MEINIVATEEEKQTVVKAIHRLNSVMHVTHTSLAMLGEECNMSQAKVRIVLQDLIDAKQILQIATNGDKKVKRYMYILTELGKTDFPL